jgi:hypothetical protein
MLSQDLHLHATWFHGDEPVVPKQTVVGYLTDALCIRETLLCGERAEP